MYIVEPYKPRVFLIENNEYRDTMEFKNYEDFLDAIDIYFVYNVEGLYTVKYENGDIIPQTKLLEDYSKRWEYLKEIGAIKKPAWLRGPKHKWEYRKDPVPNRGKIGNYKCYRRFRTQQEANRNSFEPEYSRGKRRNLPDSWHDLIRSTDGNRNWKNYRKTQWKNK